MATGPAANPDMGQRAPEPGLTDVFLYVQKHKFFLLGGLVFGLGLGLAVQVLRKCRASLVQVTVHMWHRRCMHVGKMRCMSGRHKFWRQLRISERRGHRNLPNTATCDEIEMLWTNLRSETAL
jgi:hypothetical protein